MTADRPIGVFDSGVGGLSVLQALRAEMPQEDFVYFSDAAHAPYGERGEAYVTERTLAVARQLIGERRIKALVVACNTATAAAIHLLRAEFAQRIVVGLEPALKPAVAASRTGHIGVMATRGTLASRKFEVLHEALRTQADFKLVACDGLAGAIERLDIGEIDDLARRYVADLGPLGTQAGQIDTLVLGCTHYPFIADQLRELVGPDVKFFETGLPVAQHAKRLLAAGELLAPADRIGTLELLTSGDIDALRAASSRWLSPQPASAAVAAN